MCLNSDKYYKLWTGNIQYTYNKLKLKFLWEFRPTYHEETISYILQTGYFCLFAFILRIWSLNEIKEFLCLFVCLSAANRLLLVLLCIVQQIFKYGCPMPRFSNLVPPFVSPCFPPWVLLQKFNCLTSLVLLCWSWSCPDCSLWQRLQLAPTRFCSWSEVAHSPFLSISIIRPPTLSAWPRHFTHTSFERFLGELC